jgi:acyl dehydratase
LKPGALPPLRTPAWTAAHLVRWCAAQQNWDRIHYDLGYAKGEAGLPERVVNGALKQHLLVRFLVDSFEARARLVRLDYRFMSPDLVGDALELQGHVDRVEPVGRRQAAHVQLSIRNPRLDKVTTQGRAIVMLDEPAFADAQWDTLPADWRLDESVAEADEAVPDAVRSLLGQAHERAVSFCPLDLSRLRLFADAVGGLRRWHFDPTAAAAAGLQTVVAPDLFPIHAIEPEPGQLPLSQDTQAPGREGVSEIGRNLARQLGFAAGTHIINGGNAVEVHSLLRVGETATAASRLLKAGMKRGASGGDMLVTESLNTYATTSGRWLLRERQVIAYRGETRRPCRSRPPVTR